MAKGTDIPALAGLSFEQIQSCVQLGATLEQITSLTEAGFGYEQIQQLAPSLGGASRHGVSTSDLQALLHAQRKAMRPENERHPEISVFSYPEGNVARPKATFRRDTIVLGARLREDSLTPTEIDLCNRFEVSTTARGGRWTATIRNIDGVETLIVNCLEHNTIDGRAGLPPLSLILRELLDGPAATDPNTLAERVKQLEGQIQAMQGAAA